MCSPLLYFDIPFKEIDIYKWKPTEIVSSKVIFGGGGLFHNPENSRRIKELMALVRSRKGKIIFWGAGSNYHNFTKTYYPSYISSADLIGLRDYYNNPFEYVPCPSCLHSIFKRTFPCPYRETVIFEHTDRPIDLPFPKMSNKQPARNFEDVIYFLNSAETVLTSTFHGAYWSLLLGKKVILWKPFSNRFYSFPIQLPIFSGKMTKGLSIPNYLFDCVDLNLKFYSKVRTII